MSGPFISQDYQAQESTLDDIKVASIFWGWQLGFTVLVGAEAGGLTFKVWRRTGGLTPYVIMVWVEILCNMIWGVISWMYAPPTSILSHDLPLIMSSSQVP